MGEAPGVETVCCPIIEDGRVVTRVGGTGAAPFGVHEHVHAALQEHLDVTALAHYVLADGRSVDVVRSAAGGPRLGQIDLAQSYLGAGGPLLRSSAVVAVHARRGWTGLGSRHFTAPTTVRSVACELRRKAAVFDDRPVYLL